MSLQQELLRIREYLTDSTTRPSNEANTCSWVITPLLIQCGYQYHEIDIQSHDGAGRYPDYTIMPDTPYTWFLEAKPWQDNLADSHVVQALNYAHTKGKRWVVLTNGREWRLYDDHIIGVEPADRLISIVLLECCEELEALLAALSKEAVCSGELIRYAVNARITAILEQQLQTPNSEITKSITKILRGKHGLSSVGFNDVAQYFQSLHSKANSGLQADNPPTPSKPVIIPPLSSVPKSLSEGISLLDLKRKGNEVQGWKLQSLVLPDQTIKLVSTWRDVTVGVIEWLFIANKKPDLPFSGQQRGKRCLIVTSLPNIENAAKQYKQLIVDGSILYIHVNRSITDFVRCLNVLCNEVSESSTGFIVNLRQVNMT